MPQDKITGGVEELKEQYVGVLQDEIRAHHALSGWRPLKTVYIGGGTPLEIGVESLISLIDLVLELRGADSLEELSIELNPNPSDEVLACIATIHQRYPQLFRIRWSIGVQTLDDSLLVAMKRWYTGAEAIGFLRELPALRQHNTVYSVDMIAMWVLDAKHHAPWSAGMRQVWMRMVQSGAFDGFAVYGLELFPWSDWYYTDQHAHTSPSWHPKTSQIWGDADHIRDEFHWIKTTILDAWYARYELSNFARAGKRSIHNMVYRTHGDYLGCGINASSAVFSPELRSVYADHMRGLWAPDRDGDHDSAGITEMRGLRWKNTHHWKAYLAGEWHDLSSMHVQSPLDITVETIMLQWRTDRGLPACSQYAEYFVPHWRELLADWQEQGLVTYVDDHLRYTDAGWDVYNTLITDLVERF